ncbi:chromosome segregation in meiosis- protein [Parahypoxylon ruwenzoriense]
MSSRAASAPKRPLNSDIDNYDVDDDPFAESGDEAQNNAAPPSKKSNNATSLGIDEAVNVTKKARAPIVKLDEGRLLSEKGIPRLRRKARDLKFKGKGHEFSDAARLLSFYQLWFDDLFPKAKFLDAAAMAEKAGHKKYMRMKRMEWIEEGKPKPVTLDEDLVNFFGAPDDQPEERAPAIFPARVAPIFQSQGGEKARTPTRDDVPDDDEDLYDATPRPPKTTAPASASLFSNGAGIGRNNTSIFGNGSGDEPDDDDLDALMAEEEAQRTEQKSLFGYGQPTGPRRDEPDNDDLDLDALMAEAEAQPKPLSHGSNSAPKPAQAAPVPAVAGEDGDDDLDALMAEVEAQDQGGKSREGPSPKPGQVKDVSQDMVDADEEDAMAEMDGLW